MQGRKIAVVGTGNWGRNLVRNFCEIVGAENLTICDMDQERRSLMENTYPGVKVEPQFDKVLKQPDLQAIAIATPAETHFELSKKALTAGYNVLVEKPISLHINQAIELIKLAEENQRILMVDHLLEYHPVIEEMKERIQSGELGQVYYAYGQRLNLGVVRTEENALWSLGPHDISVLLYILEKEPKRVAAHGGVYLQKAENIEDVVFLNLEFEGGLTAHSHLSWLDPHKIRKLTIVGDKKMMVFDDMENREKLKIYSKGVQKASEGGFNVRYGDVYIPNINLEEPLRMMCLHFLNCIENGNKPRSDGYDGLRVLKVLDAAQRSLENEGSPTLVMNVELPIKS